MMEMEADAAATASNEEDDGHLHEEGSDKGDMDSSQSRKDEEDPGAASVSDEAAKNTAQSTGPLNEMETVVKVTANAIKCPNNGEETKKVDVSHSTTFEESVEASSDPAKSIEKSLRTQPLAAATEPVKLLPPVSGPSQPVIPSSTAISVQFPSVPATLPKPYEIPTMSVKVSSSAAFDVTSSSASDEASSETLLKTSGSVPVSSSNIAMSRSVILPSVTMTTPAVKSAISSSVVGCEVTSSLATKLSGCSTPPSLGSQQKASPSVQLPGPTAMYGKPAEKPAAVVETSTSGPLPPKLSTIQPLTSPPSISPKPLLPKTPLIRSSVVSSSTSGKHIHKLPSPGNPTTTSPVTKYTSTSVSSANLSISSTSPVSSSSTSKPVSVSPTPSQVPSSKTVSVPNISSLRPVSKPVINPKFSSGASPNPLPIKLSRNQMPSSSSGVTPSRSSIPKQPLSLPSLGSSIPPIRPVVPPKSSCPSPSYSPLRPSKTTPSLLPSSNIRLPSCTSPSSPHALSFSISCPNAPLGSICTPLCQPSPPSPSSPSSLIPQRPSFPCPSPSSSPRPSPSLQSLMLQPQSRPIPTPPISVTGPPPTQPVAIPPRPSPPLLPNPSQRPSVPSENAHLPVTDFSVPDIRRDCPAGPVPVTPPTSIVPDVLRTGSEEEDRQLERMLHPTPFGGGIPPPLMPDLCRRGQDLPLVSTRIIRLPSGEADIDLLRPASALCRNRPNLNDVAEDVLEGQLESSNERLQDVAEAESDAGGEVNNPSLLEEHNDRVAEPFHGAVSQERTNETAPLRVGRSADSLDSNIAVDSDRVAPSSSKDTEEKDAVPASSSGAYSLPKGECFSKREGDVEKKEPVVSSTSNAIFDTKETGIKTAKSLNPDVDVHAPAEDGGSNCLQVAYSEAEAASKPSGTSDKISSPPKDDLNSAHEKLDSRVNRDVPHCGDSSYDLKGERMTVERAELDKSSLAEEEESNPSLMLPPPVADLPADPAMEDGANNRKCGGGEEEVGIGRKGGDDSGGSSKRAAPFLPILDSVVAPEKNVDVRVETAEELAKIGAASQAAQTKARLGCGDKDSANKKEDVSSKGEGGCAPPPSASGVPEKDAPRSVEGGKGKGTEARPSEALPVAKEEMVAETNTDEGNGEAAACGKVDALADSEGKTPESKKLPALGDLETGESGKPCDDKVERKVSPCELPEKEKSKESERLEKSDEVLNAVDVVEIKNSAPDAARNEKTGEGAGERRERACDLHKEKDTVVVKAKVELANAVDNSAPDGKVPEKDVGEWSGREKKEFLRDVGKFNLVNLSSGVSNDSKMTTAPVKPCDEKDLLVSEENKIRDKHKEIQTDSKYEIAGVGKAEGNSVEKQSTDQSSKRSLSNEGNGEVVELANETKGSHRIKSESLPMVASKVNVTQSVCSKEYNEVVLGSETDFENPSKDNVSISVGKSHSEKNSSSSQVQVGKDSSEKESVCSKPISLDNKKAETRPQKPIAASGMSLDVDESASLAAIESRRVDVSNKDKLDLTSAIESEKLVSYPERDNNSVLHKMHSNNVSHVSENVPAKLKKSADGVRNTLGDDKPRLPATASKETDLKQSSTEISACDGKYGTEKEPSQQKKCLSGDASLLKTPTQVFKVAIENVNEDINASKNESSKRLSNSVPRAQIVVAAVISSSVKESGGQNKDQDLTAGHNCLVSDAKVVLVSEKTNASSPRPKTADVSAVKAVSPPDLTEAGIKTTDRVGEPNQTSDASVSSSSVMASVGKPSSVSQSSGTTENDKIKNDVPLSKNNESCSKVSAKETNVVAAKIELGCGTVTRENKPDSEALTSMSDQSKVSKSNSRVNSVSDCEEKRSIEERSPKDIPVVTANQTVDEKSWTNKKDETEVGDESEKTHVSCKLLESDAKYKISPIIKVAAQSKERDLTEGVTSAKEEVDVDSAKDSGNGSKGASGVEKMVVELKKVLEKPVEDEKTFDCKVNSPDDKAERGHPSEETMKDIKQKALLLNEMPIENNPDIDKNLNSSKGASCKSENDDGVAHIITNAEDVEEKNVSLEVVDKEGGECLTKNYIVDVLYGKQLGEKSVVNTKKPSEQEESACKKNMLDKTRSLNSNKNSEIRDEENKEAIESQKGSCDNSAHILDKPISVQSLEVSSFQTFIKSEISNNNVVFQEKTSITNTDFEKSLEKVSLSLSNQDKTASTLNPLTKIDDNTSQVGESKADEIVDEPVIDVKSSNLVYEKAPENMHAIGTNSPKEKDSMVKAADDAVGGEDSSSEEGRLLGEPSKGKECGADSEDPSNLAVCNIEGAEESKTENKDLKEGKRVLEETHSLDGLSGKKAANIKEATVTEPVGILSSNSESKYKNEVAAESKSSECPLEDRSEGTSKLSSDASSPAPPPSDNDSPDGVKFKKRGEVKQSREKSILGITEKLVVANQMRQQKQGESVTKESTSPRKMPGLIEMGVAKASRRKNLAVKEEAKIKRPKAVSAHESGDSGSKKHAPDSVPGPIVEAAVGKCEIVPHVSTPSKEVVKAEAQSETVITLDPTSSRNSVKKGDDVMIPSMQGSCGIIDLSSKKADIVEQLASIKDNTTKDNSVDGHSRPAENAVVVSTEKESLDVKPTSEGIPEASTSKTQLITAENVDSPRKGEERKEEGGFRFPRMKRNSAKDKTTVETPSQPVGPTTRTRAGYKQSPPTPPLKTALKQDDTKEKNPPKSGKMILKREEKASELEPKRKNVEVSTEPFVKEIEPKKSEAPPLMEDVLSIRSSQSPISSSKLLEVIRVAGEKGRDVVKVNDVEVMREPVGSCSSPLSLLRKAATSAPVFSSFGVGGAQDQRKGSSPDSKNVSEGVQTEVMSAGSKFPPGNTESWEFVAKVGEVELLRESPRAAPKATPPPLTITVESPIKKGKDKPEGRKPGRPPSMPPPPKTVDYTMPPMKMLEQAFLAHQNFRNPALEVLVGIGNRPEGGSFDLRGQVSHMGMQMGSSPINPWQMPSEDRGRTGCRTPGMDYTGGRSASTELPSDGDLSSDKRKKGMKSRTVPPPKWSNQEADMLSVKVDGHPLGNWAPGDWRSLPPSSMPICPPGFGYGLPVRPKGPMEPRCSRSVSPPSQSGRDNRGLEQMPEDLSSPPLPRGRRDSPHSFRSPFVHPAVSFPGGTPNFSNVSVMSCLSHSTKSGNALNLAKSTSIVTPPSDTAMNLTMCKQMSATPPPPPTLCSPSQSPRQSSLPVNLVKSRSSSPKGPAQTSQNFDGRGAVLPGGIVVPNLPLIFGRDYSMPTNTPSGRVSHCSAEDNRETETSVSQVRCSSEPPRDHLLDRTREGASAFLTTNFSQRAPTANVLTNLSVSRATGNASPLDASGPRSASGEPNLLPGGVVIPNLFGANVGRPGEEQWGHEAARTDLPPRSASALSQYHTDEPYPKQATPRLPTPVPLPPPPATSTPPPPVLPKTGPGRRGGRSETPPPDKYNFRVEEAHVVRSSDMGAGGGQGGSKLFACDICSGVYRRAFSLKRHYLRAHINYCHLSERDLSNCGIVVGDKMAVHTGGSGRRPYVHTTLPRSCERSNEEAEKGSSSGGGRRTLLRDLFRCHTCGVCFDEKRRLKAHLMEHQCGSNRPSLLRQHAATHSPPVLPKATPPTKQHPSSPTPVVFLCAYCDKRFSSAAVRRRHRKLHESSPGPHPCYLCETAEDLPEIPLGETPSFAHLEDLRSHMASVHKEVYHSCALCGERLPSILSLEEHSEGHRSRRRAADASDEDEDEEDAELARATAAPCGEGSATSENTPVSSAGQGEEEEFRYTCGVCQKMFTNYVNMCRHRRLAHGAAQAKAAGRKAGGAVSGGKQCGGDSGSSSRSQSPVVVSQSGAGERGPSHRDLLDGEPSSSSSSSVPSPCPYPPSNAISANDPETIFYTRLAGNIRDNLLNYLDGKLDRQDKRYREEENEAGYANGDESSKPEPYLSWEKYNFPKDFQQMSCWDISTQLVVRNNIKKANSAPSVEHQSEHRPAFPETLALVETPKAPERGGEVKEENPETREEATVEGEWSGLSGEWVRPRSYICCACASRFGDLWTLEDHQLARHPNVWCTHLEVEDGAVVLPGSPKLSPGSANVAVSFLGDLLCRRPLGPRGALLAAPAVPPTLNNGMESPSAKCTKCSRLCPSLPDLHSHMLECGGDLAWAAWAGGSSPAASSRRNSRKWRPFGSRRRRQRGRRGMKRNIPSSPVKMHRARHRGTDSDSIQRMIANLPAKRATRRVIQFNEDDIKTRSQATIHNVSFTGNFVRVSGFKASQGVKPATPTAAKRGRPPKNPLPPPPPTLPVDGVPLTATTSPILVSLPSSAASGVASPPVVVKKGRGRPPGSKSKPNIAGLELPLKRRIGEASTDNSSVDGDRYALVKRSRAGVSPSNQHQSSSATVNAPGEPYICKGCGAVFDNASSCERHGKKCVFRRQMPAAPAGEGMRVGSSGNPRPVHSCPHCGKNFTYATPMEKHVRACGGGSSPKGLPMHIRRSTAPGVLIRPTNPANKASEVSEIPTPRETTIPPVPQEPDMPQLQKEEPVASPLPKEEDIPVLTPVESDEDEDKKVSVEEEVVDKEAQIDLAVVQESDKSITSDSDKLITSVEGEMNKVVEEVISVELLSETKVDIKNEVINIPDSNDLELVTEGGIINSSEAIQQPTEISLEDAVVEKSEDSGMDEKDSLESPEDKLLCLSGKRTRGISSTGQIAKKNKSEDAVEDLEEEEMQKKKPGRKSQVTSPKAKTPKGNKVTREAKTEDETNTEEGAKDTVPLINTSLQEITTDNKREEISVESEEKSQQEIGKSDADIEREASKVPDKEEKAKENAPTTEVKSKRGRKPKYPRPQATQETVAKTAQEKPDSDSVTSGKKKAVVAESVSPKSQEAPDVVSDKEPKDNQTDVDIPSQLNETQVLSDTSKDLIEESKERKEKGDTTAMDVDDTDINVEISEEKKLADQGASKSDEAAISEETSGQKDASKVSKENEDAEDGDDEGSNDKDSKLRGTKGPRGKVTKTKKKKKKWHEVKKEVESFWCDVCQMGYSSAFNLVKHGMSQKHKWNLRLGKEKMEKLEQENESKATAEEGEGEIKLEGDSSEKDLEESSTKEQKKLDNENAGENNCEGENSADDQEKGIGDKMAGVEKVEDKEKVVDDGKDAGEKKDKGEDNVAVEVAVSEMAGAQEAADEKSKEEMAVEINTEGVEKSLDSAKSKENETADAMKPAPDSFDNKDGVSESGSKEGIPDNEGSLEKEVTKKEDSPITSVIAEEPAFNADASVNITNSAMNADDTKSSLPKDKTDIALVSLDSSEKAKLNQAGREDGDKAPVNEEDGSATKVSPEAVVAAAPESATVIEGNKSTSEGVQRGTWQEATATPPPSQEFLQPPIPPPTSYNPLYEWDTNLVQPAPLHAQPGGPQHLHQTQQQDGWGAYGGWEASNADPNPPPSPGLWRYQPPTPIPWGEPQHSLSPIPRMPSYTEDTLPAANPSPPNPSLGSILDSVNRILGEDGSGFDSTRIHAATAPEEEYGGVGLFGEGGLAELQRAMGATDEEMAMLQQLGTGPLDFVYDNNAGTSSVTDGNTEAQDQTGPLPNAELVDLDNQAAAVTMVEEGPIEEAETAAVPPVAVETSNVLVTDGRGSKRKRCGPLPSKCKRLPPPNREGGRGWRGGRRPALAHASLASAHLFISQYEKKEMVCPVCNRHFLGLAALETHVAWVHKMKDAKQHILEGETAGHPSGSESFSKDRNQSLPPSEKATPTASNSLRELVTGRAGTGGVVVGGGGAAPSPTPSRRLPCFVCKELYSDVISLNHHIAQQHLRRRPGEGGVVPEMDGDLKSQMTSALGGLLGKALANMRSRSDTNSPNSRGLSSTTNKSPHLSFPKLNLLNKSLEKGSPTAENASRKSFGGPSGCDGSGESLTRAEPSSESPEVTLFRREDGVDPSEWSSDGEDSAKGHEIEVHDEGVIPSFHHICPFCGDRFQKLSSRNRHISVAHRDPSCIDMMRMPRNTAHESSDFDDLLSRSRKDDGDGILVKDDPSEETQETGRRHNHHPCPACQLSFLRHSQLEAHLKRAHNGSDSQLQDTSDSMMECPICRESMNHFLKLCKHVKAKHREWSINCFTTDMHHHLILRKESPEESMVIRKKFLVKMKAFPVLRMASPTPSSKSSEEESYMDPDPKGNYLCSVCGVNFKSPQGVIRHLNLEHNSNHLEGALPMQKIFPRHASKEYRGRTGGGSGSDIKAKAEAALRELNLSQKLKLGGVAAAKGMAPAKGAGSRKSEGEVQGVTTQTRGGGGRGRGSNRRGRGRRGGRVAASSDIEKSLFDVYEFEDDEEEAEEAGSRVGSADGGSSRMDSECGGDDEEEEEEGGTGEEEGKGSTAASIRAKRASVDSSSSEVKYSCNSCGKGYKSLAPFWRHTKGVRGACAGGSCSPRSGDRGQDVVLRGCKVSGKKGSKEEEGEGSDAEGEASGRVLRRLRGSTGESPAAVVLEGTEAGQSSETEVPKKGEKGSRKGRRKGEEEKKPVFSGGETVRTYGGKRWVKQQQQAEEKKGRGSEEGGGGRRSLGASEAAFDALRGGGGS